MKLKRWPSRLATCIAAWLGPTTGIVTTSRQACSPGSPMQSMMIALAPSFSASIARRIVSGTLIASSNSLSIEAGPCAIRLCVIARSGRMNGSTSSSVRMPSVMIGVISSMRVFVHDASFSIGREGIGEAECLRPEHRERRGRAHDRRGADAEHGDALAVLQALGRDRLGRRARRARR